MREVLFAKCFLKFTRRSSVASYLHEKQTSRIQSLYLYFNYFIKIVPFWLRNIRFLIQNTRSLFYGRHYSSLRRLMSLHGKLNVKIFLMFIVAENAGSVNITECKSWPCDPKSVRSLPSSWNIKMCNFDEIGQQEAQRATYRAPEHNVPAFWQISQGGNFCLLIGLKNTNLVEDVEILLPVKFRWIPFSGFREEVINFPANQRPGRQSCFSDQPEKHKLGRGHWDLASCQVSLNSIQRFQRSRKCLSQIRGQDGHLVFPIGPKNTNLVEDIEILLPVMFRWIPFSGLRGEVENVSTNQRLWWPSCFSDRPKKHKLGRGRWDLASCQVSLNSVQRFQMRSRKCLSQSEARAAILFFQSARKTQTW